MTVKGSQGQLRSERSQRTPQAMLSARDVASRKLRGEIASEGAQRRTLEIEHSQLLKDMLKEMARQEILQRRAAARRVTAPVPVRRKKRPQGTTPNRARTLLGASATSFDEEEEHMPAASPPPPPSPRASSGAPKPCPPAQGHLIRLECEDLSPLTESVVRQLLLKQHPQPVEMLPGSFILRDGVAYVRTDHEVRDLADPFVGESFFFVSPAEEQDIAVS